MTRAARENAGVPLAPGEQAGIYLHPQVGDNWSDTEPGPVRRLAEQLPDPSTLRPGIWVALSVGPAAPRRLLGLLGGRRRTGMHLAVRCTALLARGFTNICADEAGTAFGRVPH